MSDKPTKEQGERLLFPVEDRRLLPHVPDPEYHRSRTARRGEISHKTELLSDWEQTKENRYPVEIHVCLSSQNGGKKISGDCVQISATGMLITLSQEDIAAFSKGNCFQAKFRIPAGTIKEGIEGRVNESVNVANIYPETNQIGVQFQTPLNVWLKNSRDRLEIPLSLILMVIVLALIAVTRVDLTKPLIQYGTFAFLFFLLRYFFAIFYHPKKVDPDYNPGVSIIIPCFNEETWIRKTILSCVDQNYDIDKLEVIVVDDHSTDKSREMIIHTLNELAQNDDRFKTRERVKYVFRNQNGGKREAIAAGFHIASHELITFVDSDSFLEPDAIKNIVQPFSNPKVGGVSGRTDVANTYTNWVTKIQATRYYTSFRVMKAVESYFHAVLCLSGPLSCYRRSLLEKNMDSWLNQTFCGQKATFGDDRALTALILRENWTVYQHNAVCSTIAPSSQKMFLKQQMRWKRSWLRESLRASSFMWRKNPIISLFFYVGLIFSIAAPFILIYALIWYPIVRGVFPLHFSIGLLLTAVFMSVLYLLIRRSSLWLYAFILCFYYEFILLWQMPWACLTFWVSTWGTRETLADQIEEDRKKGQKEPRRLIL